MASRVNIEFDSNLLDHIASEFELRKPNKAALRELIFNLNGDYDPGTMQVLNLATGVGKTYVMAAFIEYLRCQGIENVMIVTPGKVVQKKTVQNFTKGSARYIEGSAVPPQVVTPSDYSAWVSRKNSTTAIMYGREVPVLAFIFNIHQLIAPSSSEGSTHGNDEQSQRRRPRKYDETAGVLFDYLKELDNLVVIADESHLYSESAVAFSAALRELDPAATIGLTASPLPGDHVIFKYALYEAIRDKHIKTPVLAFRKNGYSEDSTSEEQQLSDAVQLRQYKQQYYDLYASQSGTSHINAVLFVVCSDKNHATDVAALLRTPRYFGCDLSVLQVDSDHEDEGTQRLLDNLDQPDSPVLAVVSVNKLKEGWDVKNIAVVVTLRAMASEVLTQQTMGRGLRLPFGAYTGVPFIDQLDIIAHQSFKELLAAENILVQFGLEDAVEEAQRSDFNSHLKNMAQNGGNTAAGQASSPDSGTYDTDGQQPTPSRAAACTQIPEKPNEGPSPAQDGGIGYPTLPLFDVGGGVGVCPFESGSFEPVPLSVETVPRNPRFADVSYWFPCTKVELSEPTVSLTDIDIRDIETAAKRVTSTNDVLHRKEIVATLGKRLSTSDTVSAEISSMPIDDATVKEALLKLVLDAGLVTANTDNIRTAKDYLVAKFVQKAAIEQWTVKSLDSAYSELSRLLRDFASAVLRQRKEQVTIVAKKMPASSSYELAIGDRVYDPIESGVEFVRGRHYSGWTNSLFEAESFDSYTGEYLLAKLLLTSPHIKWWHRLHTRDGARISYTPRDNYYPDFVALDDEGIHWIIEGKAQYGLDDDVVQNKRKAAESVVYRLLSEEQFSGQKWGYLIAYEDDIKAAESWDDLKIKSQPINNS